MDKHSLITKIIAGIMVGLMVIASASTLLYYLLTK